MMIISGFGLSDAINWHLTHNVDRANKNPQSLDIPKKKTEMLITDRVQMFFHNLSIYSDITKPNRLPSHNRLFARSQQRWVGMDASSHGRFGPLINS